MGAMVEEVYNNLKPNEYLATVECNNKNCKHLFSCRCKIGDAKHIQEKCPYCDESNSTKVWP
jgi:hypothetical protein